MYSSYVHVAGSGTETACVHGQVSKTEVLAYTIVQYRRIGMHTCTHMESNLGVVYKTDQSDACSTHGRNLDGDIFSQYTGRTHGRVRTVTWHL